MRKSFCDIGRGVARKRIDVGKYRWNIFEGNFMGKLFRLLRFFRKVNSFRKKTQK